MNYTPFGTHLQTLGTHLHQLSNTKLNAGQFQAAMLVTAGVDGTIQYIRPDQAGATFITTSTTNNNPVQTIATTLPIATAAASSRGIAEIQQHVQQQQLAAIVNQTTANAANVVKYQNSGTILSWGDIPIMSAATFNEAAKNIATINVPFTTQGLNTGTILTVQPPPPSISNSQVFPVKMMQSVATMTYESDIQPQDLCKEDSKTLKENEDLELKKEDQELKYSDCESDIEEQSIKSEMDEHSATEELLKQGEKNSLINISLSNTGSESPEWKCNQLQLQQQGNAMAEYLAKLQPTQLNQLNLATFQHLFMKQQQNSIEISEQMAMSADSIDPIDFALNMEKDESNDFSCIGEDLEMKRKKKKKVWVKKPPRPRPGEIRLSTALDGSILYCCSECHVAYPDKSVLEEHMSGHKMERRFVCTDCGASLKRKEHLDQHRKGHSEERPFVCSMCLKGFKRNEHLTRHYTVHSGDKNHNCTLCGKMFSRKDHLHKHVQTHIARRVKAELMQANSNRVERRIEGIGTMIENRNINGVENRINTGLADLQRNFVQMRQV